MTVTCNGCFDGLHKGHLFYLGYCAGIANGGSLIVGINSYTYMKANKRLDPTPEVERIKAIMELGFVNHVEVFHDSEPSNFISRWNPDIHCIGEEYRGKAPEEKRCKELGTKVIYIPRVGPWSTSAGGDDAR